MEHSDNMVTILKSEFERRIEEESFSRIKQCLLLLSHQQIWHRPNGSSNSIGNLVLHLCGNIRQYINSGIGNHPDKRTRDNEFAENGVGVSAEQLIQRLHQVIEDVKPTINSLRPSDLVEIKKVQGFEEPVLSIVIHVIEHMSYHTGQIAFYTKILLDQDLKFYGDLDLNITSS